jgi:putative transposase
MNCIWSIRLPARACCARMLRRERFVVERKHLSTLMKRTDVEALYRKPNKCRKYTPHKIWPHLPRNRKIEGNIEVWALDTTYAPMARGFVYLTAVVEWASRRVLAHRVAITLEAQYAVTALDKAFAKYGQPEIVNTNQGSQFTSEVFTDAVLGKGILFSIEDKGNWRDNEFVEPLWSSVKYEKTYLTAYEPVG